MARLELHKAGQHEVALARANRGSASALAINLVSSLRRHSGSAAWNGMASDNHEAASSLELHHRRLALDAFSVMAAIAHAACGRLTQAQVELFRINSVAGTNHADPAVHSDGYDLVAVGSNAKTRKREAVYKANVVTQDFEAMMDHEIVPIQAAKLLGRDVAVDEVRERAKPFPESNPYSARAQLLRVFELEHVRALDLPADRKRHLRRILALVSGAAVVFDRSLLIALFHAKVLFVLDEFDESERECRRALHIDEPTDPNLDDIPPAVSVPGADCDARVASVKRQLRVFLNHIIVVAALYWPSIKSTRHHAGMISVKVDVLHAHYDRFDKSAATAKTISDAHRYLKKHNSWSFLLCPNSRCDGRKFVDTESLCLRMCINYRDVLWKKLESVLGPDLTENASNDDHSLEGITLSQDSKQHDIFNLPRVKDMFESLLHSTSIGIQAEPLAEMRQRKCREGYEILEDIKEKLKMLPEDVVSTEFEEFRSGVQILWLKFLEVSLLDYREVILPLARSYQWIGVKQWIARNVSDPQRSIGDANIDDGFGKVPAAPDHQSGDKLKVQDSMRFVEVVLLEPENVVALTDADFFPSSQPFLFPRTKGGPDTRGGHHRVNIISSEVVPDVQPAMDAMEYAECEATVKTRGGVDRSDVKPVIISQPEGPSFRITGSFVEWQKVNNIRIGFTPKEGLVIHYVAYVDGNRGRLPIAFVEMVIPYGDPNKPHYQKNTFDAGEDGSRKNAHSLKKHLSAFTALQACNGCDLEPSDRADGLPSSGRDRHGGRFGIPVPNIIDTVFTGDIEEMGWVDMNELLGEEVDWNPLALSGGRHQMEPCLIVDNPIRSRTRLFFPYDDYISDYGSNVQTSNIISVWGPLLLIRRDFGIFILNLQTFYFRKVWDTVLESKVIAGSIDYGRIVLAGIRNEAEMELWERMMEGHEWEATRLEYGESVASFLAIYEEIFWISGNHELVNVRKDEAGDILMNVYDLDEGFTVRPQDMSMVWCGDDLMIIEVKQEVAGTPIIVWKVTWDMEDNVSYSRCFTLLGFNAFIVPGYSGFILPADEGEVGDKVYVGDGATTDCYMYSLSESARLDVMLCGNLPSHWSCCGRWMALRENANIHEELSVLSPLSLR